MFLLNPGRYVIGDPANILQETTCKKLWESPSRLDAHVLRTPAGTIIAFSTGKSGVFRTDLGPTISTVTGSIAFAPYMAAEKLLPFEMVRISLANPAILFFDAASNIVLDRKLTIFIENGPACR